MEEGKSSTLILFKSKFGKSSKCPYRYLNFPEGDARVLHLNHWTNIEKVVNWLPVLILKRGIQFYAIILCIIGPYGLVPGNTPTLVFATLNKLIWPDVVDIQFEVAVTASVHGYDRTLTTFNDADV